MQTLTHARLARALFPLLPKSAAKHDRLSFCFGMIEPDPNLITWAIDSKPFYRMDGHSYPNCVRRALKDLVRTERFRYYRVGVSLHYLADAFTHPHNPSFTGSLSAHFRYEDALERYIRSTDTKPLLNAFDGRAIQSVEAFFTSLHAEYEKETPSLAVDARYVYGAGAAIMRYLTGRD